MEKKRVLVTARFLSPGDLIENYLKQAGLEIEFRRVRDEEEMASALKGVDAVICGNQPRITARAIESADRLKVISRTGVGYNNVAVEAATAKGIPVCLTPGVNRHAVAEWTFTLLLACARKLLENLVEVDKKGWAPQEGVELAGKTLGIVGLGIIGKEVAQRAKAFEMQILANDPIVDQPFAEANGVTYVPLEELLRESDFVSLHLSLNAQGHHLINAQTLALMKPTAFLINTSRGGAVDSEALYHAIKEKRIAGAGLDVHEQEPLGDSPLRGLTNVLLTPHASAATYDFRMQTQRATAESVIRVLQGQRPLFVVNPEVFE